MPTYNLRAEIRTDRSNWTVPEAAQNNRNMYSYVEKLDNGNLLFQLPFGYCRDGLISFMHDQLNKVVTANPTLKLSAYGDLEFTYQRVKDYDSKTYLPTELGPNMAGRDVDDWLGFSIKGLSPVASPYLLRYYIGRIRDGQSMKWFEDICQQASRNYVFPMGRNFKLAWNIPAERNGEVTSYGATSFFHLSWLAAAGSVKPQWGQTKSRADFAEEFKLKYRFPPARFLK